MVTEQEFMMQATQHSVDALSQRGGYKYDSGVTVDPELIRMGAVNALPPLRPSKWVKHIKTGEVMPFMEGYVDRADVLVNCDKDGNTDPAAWMADVNEAGHGMPESAMEYRKMLEDDQRIYAERRAAQQQARDMAVKEQMTQLQVTTQATAVQAAGLPEGYAPDYRPTQPAPQLPTTAALDPTLTMDDHFANLTKIL